MDGIVFIDKDIDYTSKDITMMVGKKFGSTKVGHVGTLDPFASGLLMVMVNKATKTLICFEDFNKEYEVTIKLGEFKDSMDITGKTVESMDIPNLTKVEIEKVLLSFKGKSMQTVPLTSAVHVNGKRLYEYAHKGKSIELPSREIEVYDIELLDYTSDEITFRVNVSKGTYIRVLGADIAKKLGTVGYLKSLRRTAVGPFNVSEAVRINDLKEEDVKSTGDVLTRFIKSISVNDQEALDIKNGKIKAYTLEVTSDKLLVLDNENNPIALYTNIDNQYIFRRGLF